MPRFPMRQGGSRALRPDEARTKGWARVFGFVSREQGLFSFLGDDTRVRKALEKAFGTEGDGPLLIAHVLAVDAAHSVRRALSAESNELIRIENVLGHLCKLRMCADGRAIALARARSERAVLRKCNELLVPIQERVLGTFIWLKAFSAERGPERIVAFSRVALRLPEKLRVPKSYAEVLSDVKAIRKGVNSSKLELVLSKLDALATDYGTKDAFKAVQDFLDDIGLDHTWHEEVDLLERDYESGALVCYETLRRRGEELVKKGEWIRKQQMLKAKEESKLKTEETNGNGRVKKPRAESNKQRRNFRDEIAEKARHNKPPVRSVQESDETEEPKENEDLVEDTELPKKMHDELPIGKHEKVRESPEDGLEMARELVQSADEEMRPIERIVSSGVKPHMEKGVNNLRENADENISSKITEAVRRKLIACGDAVTVEDEKRKDKPKDTGKEREVMKESKVRDKEETQMNSVNGYGAANDNIEDDAIPASVDKNKARQKRRKEEISTTKWTTKEESTHEKPKRKAKRRNRVRDFDDENDTKDAEVKVKNNMSVRRSFRQPDIDMDGDAYSSDAEEVVEIQKVRQNVVRDDSEDELPTRKSRKFARSKQVRTGRGTKRRNDDEEEVRNPMEESETHTRDRGESLVLMSDTEDDSREWGRARKRPTIRSNARQDLNDDIRRRQPLTSSALRRSGQALDAVFTDDDVPPRRRPYARRPYSRSRSGSTRRESRLSRRKTRIARDEQLRKRTFDAEMDTPTKRRRYSLTKSERRNLEPTQLAFVERYQFDQTQEVSITSLLDD